MRIAASACPVGGFEDFLGTTAQGIERGKLVQDHALLIAHTPVERRLRVPLLPLALDRPALHVSQLVPRRPPDAVDGGPHVGDHGPGADARVELEPPVGVILVVHEEAVTDQEVEGQVVHPVARLEPLHHRVHGDARVERRDLRPRDRGFA